MKTRRPDFITYFGTPCPAPFVPLAFWVFPVVTPIALHKLIKIFLTDPWVQA